MKFTNYAKARIFRITQLYASHCMPAASLMKQNLSFPSYNSTKLNPIAL